MKIDQNELAVLARKVRDLRRLMIALLTNEGEAEVHTVRGAEEVAGPLSQAADALEQCAASAAREASNG